MTELIRAKDFEAVARGIKPDSKKRVGLGKALKGVDEDVTYHVFRNSLGQIVLDPEINIPASEIWLYRNKKALASVVRGLEQSAQGKTRSRGSFAKFLEDES